MKQCREDKDKGNKILQMHDVDIGKNNKLSKVLRKIKIGFGTMGMECMAWVAMDAKSWK